MTDVKYDIVAKLGVGDVITGVENVTKLDGSETNFVHNQGEVVLLDFWATWCPPCQGPMAHNQKMLTDNAAKWGDKVRICGLSID